MITSFICDCSHIVLAGLFMLYRLGAEYWQRRSSNSSFPSVPFSFFPSAQYLQISWFSLFPSWEERTYWKTVNSSDSTSPAVIVHPIRVNLTSLCYFKHSVKPSKQTLLGLYNCHWGKKTAKTKLLCDVKWSITTTKTTQKWNWVL